MFKLKTAAFAAMLALSAGCIAADANAPAANACPSGEYDAHYPGVPVQCVKCAAPDCAACHNERTDQTVADTKAAARNCPQPH